MVDTQGFVELLNAWVLMQRDGLGIVVANPLPTVAEVLKTLDRMARRQNVSLQITATVEKALAMLAGG